MSGIAFAILLFAGIFEHANQPDITVGGSVKNSYFTNSSHRVQALVGMYLIVLAVLCFVPFLLGLVERLRQASPERDALRDVALVFGALFAGMLLLYGAVWAVPAAAISMGHAGVPNPDVATMMPPIANLILLIPGMFVVAALMIASGVMVLRTASLPRWFAWFSFVIALIEIVAGWLFLPILLVPLWGLVSGVALLRAAPARQAQGLEQTGQRSSLEGA